MEISVVYPAYNERRNILRTIDRSLAALRPRFTRFEIIIVDDASTDETGAIAEALARRNPEISVLRNARNLGVGPSLLRGFEAARMPFVVFNGMDYPLDLDDLDRMTAAARDADVVVACRDRSNGYTAWRLAVSAINRCLLRLLFNLRLSDMNFVQLYRRDVLRAVRVDARSAGFTMPEIMIRAHDMGYRLVEIPIPYHARTAGSSVLGRPKVLWGSLRDMLRFWFRRSELRAASGTARRGESR